MAWGSRGGWLRFPWGPLGWHRGGRAGEPHLHTKVGLAAALSQRPNPAWPWLSSTPWDAAAVLLPSVTPYTCTQPGAGAGPESCREHGCAAAPCGLLGDMPGLVAVQSQLQAASQSPACPTLCPAWGPSRSPVRVPVCSVTMALPRLLLPLAVCGHYLRPDHRLAPGLRLLCSARLHLL